MNTTAQILMEGAGPGSGLVSRHVLVSKEAVLEKTARGLDNAEILGNARMLGNSVAAGYSKIMDDAAIRDTQLYDHARVGGNARVDASVISGTADIRGDCHILGCVLTNNVVVTGNVRMSQCHIGCNARVLDRAVLYNVLFRSERNGDINNTIVIEGDAELDFSIGMELLPGTRLHEGLWVRPPLVIDTPIFPMVEGVGDRVQIGCQNRPIGFWRKKGLDTLLRYGLDANLYDVFYSALDRMETHKNEFGSPDNPRRKIQ